MEPSWYMVAQQFGVPVAILFALMLGTWRALSWLGKNILKPMADRHLRFLDRLETGIDTLVETQTQLACDVRKIIENEHERTA